MKVFVIPSWYPSASNPIYGTFIQEQIDLMSAVEKDLRFGVSLWGQGDDPFLIYARKPLNSAKKLATKHQSSVKHNGKKTSYFHPAFTWTKRFRKGNLKGLLKVNQKNLEAFIKDYCDPDVIHAQASYPAAWIGKFLSEKFGIPYVVTLRMSPFPFAEFVRDDQLDSELKEVLDGAKLLIATSQSLANRAHSFGLRNVRVVNNPANLELFKPLRDKQKSKTFNLLAVGRLEPQKGFDILIRAMQHVSEKAKLTIIGEGTERNALQSAINELHLSNRIRLYGQFSRAHVANAMQKADGYVLSSRHETFGNVLVEAMACGIPSVATRCGGPEEILSESTGIFCKTEDVADLADSINQLIENDWDSDFIREDAIRRFSAEVFTNRMIKIYKEASYS